MFDVLCGKTFALCGFCVQIFMGSLKRENFGLSRKQHKREKSFQSSPFITFEQRANFEEEDKREENIREENTHTRKQAPPR